MMKKKEEKILTLHPQGKKGVNISLTKYLVMKEFILDQLRQRDGQTFAELNMTALETFKNKWQGSIPWYLITVKLDMEARGLIERDSSTKPYLIRLKK
ncbi:MAG: hypothetical protein WBB45_11625 [Cyclobacteriaceae bacterium]